MLRETTEVRLELALGVEPIAGSIKWATGCPCPFYGWLELLTALDLARGGGPSAPGTDEEGPCAPRD